MEILLTNYSAILITIAIILRLFSKTKKLAYLAYAVSLGVALGQNYIEPIGFAYILVSVAVMSISCSKKIDKLIHISALIFILIFGYNLISHNLPGFNNIQLVYEQLTPNTSYYSLWLNYDSLLFLSALFLTKYKEVNFKKSFKAISIGVLFAIPGIIILAIIALTSGTVKFEFFIPDIIWTWIWIAALYALFEETFFRMYIIDSLTTFKPDSKLLLILAVTTSVTLFALRHLWGGEFYALLAGVAGLLYTFSYIYSEKRIESSFVTHFTVNLTHIIFFTYPFAL